MKQDIAVPIPQDVGGEPAVEAECPGFEAWSHDGLYQGLAGLEILAADRHALVGSEFLQGGDVRRQVWGAVAKGDA